MHDKLKLILLDADGVLWRGGQVIPQAPGFIARAQAAGLRCVLVSNNAGPNRSAYAAKCAKLGLALDEADIFSVNSLAGPFIARHYGQRRVLVLGSEMLVESVAQHVPAVGAQSWLDERGIGGRLTSPEQLKVLQEADFELVLCGVDINVSYAKLALACVVLARSGAVLLAANSDPTFPFEDGMTLPGNGSVVGLISSVCGCSYTVLGKPESHLLDQIEAETGVSREEMLMIGDRVETDIRFAEKVGMPAFLVLTGVTSEEAAPQDAAPRLRVVKDLEAVARALGI